MRKYRNQMVAGLLFISGVLIAVVVVTGADDLADRLENFPLWLFVPVFLLKCVNWALRYIEWRYFLGVIGVRTVRVYPSPKSPPRKRGGDLTTQPDSPSLRAGRGPGGGVNDTQHDVDNPSPRPIRERDSVVLWLAGLALSISPGKLAEVLKALVLKYLTGIDFARAAPVIFLERLVDGLAVIPLTTAAMLIAGNRLDRGDVSLSYVRAVLIGVTGALLVGMILIQIRPLALWVLDLTAHWPGIRRIHGSLRSLYESSYDLIKPRHLLPTVGLGLGAYLSDCVGFYLLLRGLDIPGGWTLFWQGSFILGFSVIIASLSTLPGGAGGRELTIGPMLISILGLSKADSGTATFLIGMFMLWVGVLVGLVVIAVFRGVLFPPALEDEIAAYEAARRAS